MHLHSSLVHVLISGAAYSSLFLPWMQCTPETPCNSSVSCQLAWKDCRPFLIFCPRLFNLLFLIYAIIQIGEIQNSTTTSEGIIHVSVNTLTNIIPVVISVAEIAYIALGWKIYNEFGWKVYKFLGADRRIKKMYASYQIFLCLVKFDLFFWVGFSVQFLWLVLSNTDWEYYVTWAALPLSIVLLIEGHLAARHENRWMMATFMSGCIGALVYFIYKASWLSFLFFPPC